MWAMGSEERALSRPLLDRFQNLWIFAFNKGCWRCAHIAPPQQESLFQPFWRRFVWLLHEQLCEQYHDAVAFFDAKTLPKAEPASTRNILEEARGSKLGVLVLTEEFFMHTPNPMLELEAFVASEVRLLPLFFTMSVDKFKQKNQRARCEERWRQWSSVDEGVLNAWRHALDLVSIFAVLDYCKIATTRLDYAHKIVNEVTHIIPPAISYSEEGVGGKDRLCMESSDFQD